MEILKGISIAADLVTLAGVITALRFAFVKKDENVLAFNLHQISLHLAKSGLFDD